MKNRKNVVVAIILLVVCLGFVFYRFDSGSSDLENVKNSKVKIVESKASKLKLVDYSNDVFSMKVPDGYKIDSAGVGVFYAIHVYDFKIKKFMFTFIMAVMMIPTQVTALGFLQLIGKMKMDDTFTPLIIPAIAAPVTYFYMKQYMESTLPLAIIEAARIDGSGEFRAFNSIVLPMMKPAIAVQAIFTFVSSWNNYFTPALILHNDKMKTLPILIAQLRSADFLKFDMGQVYVTIAFSIFPVIVVYLILSKFIVQGVAMGSVKG